MISIAMTTYNGGDYVSAQLDSILSQTFSDFELVICDDVSSDDTFVILQKYAQKDSRLRVFRNEQNLGFKKNFEKAISYCSGTYIAFCDQDDIWFPEHLEVLVKNIKNNDLISADSVLFWGEPLPAAEKDKRILLSDTNQFYRIPENQQDLLYRFLANTMCTPGHNILAKKDFVITYLPIPESVKYHDAWFATVAVIKGQYSYVTRPLTYYRQHGKQVTKHTLYSYTGGIKNIIKALLRKKKYVTDRISMLNEIRKLGIDSQTEAVFEEIEIFQKWRMHQSSKEESKKAVSFFKENYQLIQTRKDNKFKKIRYLELLALRFASR